MDAIPNGKQYDYKLPAFQGVMYIDKLFELEKKIKSKCKTYEDIQKARLEKKNLFLRDFGRGLII